MTKKHVRTIAVILSAVMILSVVSVSTGGFGLLNAKAEQNSAGDIKMAGDISNITGIDTETILKIKNEGLSWNEVLEKLKGVHTQSGNTLEERSSILLTQSLSDDQVERLKEEGFAENEIIEARLLIERVQFQLDTIRNGNHAVTSTMAEGETTEDEKAAYNDLAERMDMAVGLPFLLRIKNDLGSYEKALDEYLSCLQLDIDPQLYFTDKEAYLEEKSTKGADRKWITVQCIEEKMLLIVQKENQENRDKPVESEPEHTDFTLPKLEGRNAAPDNPVPEIDAVIPRNPADTLMNEIKAIDPMRKD